MPAQPRPTPSNTLTIAQTPLSGDCQLSSILITILTMVMMMAETNTLTIAQTPLSGDYRSSLSQVPALSSIHYDQF